MKELEEWEKLHNFYMGSDYLTKDLADFLNVTSKTIQRWLKGSSRPSKKKLEKIKIYLARKPVVDSGKSTDSTSQ